MSKVLVFSKLFEVSEWSTLPNVDNYTEGTYAYNASMEAWFAIGTSSFGNSRRRSKPMPAWVSMDRRNLPREVKAMALLLNIPL